jgi:hypothetical protein
VANVFNNNTYPEEITPIAPAVGILHYGTNVNKIGALRCDNGTYKVVYFGVGPEQMSNAAVALAMVQVSHDWFYGVVGVSEFEAMLADALGQAYPVPASDRITIPLNELKVAATIEVFDATGRKVMEQRVASGSSQIVLDVAGLEVGLYRYALRTAEGMGAARAFQVVR